MSISYILKKATGADTLRGLIEKKFERLEPVSPPDGVDWIRASSIAYICPREQVLLKRCSLLFEDSRTDPDLLLCFLHGTSLHWGCQNRLFPEVGVIRGQWRCRMCGTLHGGLSQEDHEELDALMKCSFQEDFELERFGQLMKLSASSETMIPRPKTCSGCEIDQENDWPSMEFEERWFGDPEVRIGGHPDGGLVVPWREGPGVLEIKSISDRGAYLVRHVPKEEHILQAQVYMKLMNYDWALILYWAKGTYGTKALLEHEIERDDARLLRIWRALKGMWDGLAGGDVPKRICKSKHCKRAGECALKKICFDIEN